MQELTGHYVQFIYIDQSDKCCSATEAAGQHCIDPEVVKHTGAKRGFVLLARRWMVERSFGWAVRFRSLSRENERLAATLGTLRFLGCACFMFATLFKMLSTDLISGSRTVTLASGQSEPAPAGLHFTGMAFCVVAAIVSVSFTEELTTHGILQAIDPDFKPNVDKSAFLR